MTRRPSSQRAIDRVRGAVRRDLEALGLETMVLDALDANRLERPVADVQRDLRRLRRRASPSASTSAGVKCRPAVGAAIEPRVRANIVW